MKVFKIIIILFFIFTTSISCKNENKATENTIVQKEPKTPEYEKMEFHIKGMTCEIGCARLIESKLSKTKGIKFSKVIFKDSLGMVEYDKNTLNKNDVFNVVEKIADGTLYKVIDNVIVTEFNQKK
jgi:copper chaperone CopZ